ncbi:MAG: ABC transporter permease [bacterium]|nr:ABC transporter permease [bacterium]
MIKKNSFSLLPLFTGLMYLFLYLPITLLILFSFNDDQFAYGWVGFTTKWYHMLFHSVEVWDALKNSVIIASMAVILSLSMGTLLVFNSNKRIMKQLMMLFYGSIAVPEIVLAVGLLSFFSFFFVTLGLSTLIVCHTLIGLGYVVPIIYTQYNGLDKSIIEVAYDLGATRRQAFFTVILPLILPALVSGGLLVFIISFDDFILSFFCSGATTQTLPVYIFSVIRAGASPMINAVSTLLLLTSSLLMLFLFSVQVKKRMDMW